MRRRDWSPLARVYSYVCVNSSYFKRILAGAYENVAIVTAIGINDDGHRKIVGAADDVTKLHEIRRRTRVVGKFSDGRSALMLVVAKLKYVVGSK